LKEKMKVEGRKVALEKLAIANSTGFIDQLKLDRKFD